MMCLKMKMLIYIVLPSLSSESEVISFSETELFAKHQFKDCHMTSGAKLKP